MSKQKLLIVITLIFLLPLNVFSWDEEWGDEDFGDEEFSDDFSGGFDGGMDSGGFDEGMDSGGFVEEKPSGGNKITGEKILKAAQRHGMTDNELRYFLKSTNPDLNVKDQKFGANALIHASINNRPNMVLMLLDVGDMAVDAKDYNGETALIGAARHCHQKVIDILLEHGAEKSIMGKFKKTAFDYAAQNCSQSLAKNIGGPSGKQLSSMSAIVKAKSAFKRKKRPRGGGGVSTAQGKRALNDIVKIKGILDYMDKYKRPNPKAEKNNFDKMAKIVGVWPDINRKNLQRAAEEEKRKQQMRRNIQQKKKRAMTKLRTMGMLRKGGTDYRARMDELERKKKIDNIIAEKENEIINDAEKDKEKDIKEGMKRKRRAINLIIFSGSRGRNINSLKNEKEEVIIRKWQSIKELLDAKEGRYESMAKLKMARKKSQAISRFKMGGKQFRITMNKLALEEKKAKERAEKEARLAAERKRIELENKLKREKKRLLAELNRKEKALQDALKREEERRLAEEKRKKALEEKLKNEREPVMVIGDDRPDSSLVKIDKKNKTIITADFRLNFLKSRNCQIRKRTNGSYFLFVLTYKATNIKQSGRNNAIWFINRSAKSVGEMGGKKCPRSSCKDFAIYHSGGVRKDLFMSNLTVELGTKPKDHFEIYSSRPSNPVIKVSVKECKNFPKR